MQKRARDIWIPMLIHVGFNIEFELPAAAEAFFALSIHPSFKKRIWKGERLRIEPGVPISTFIDPYGNTSGRAHLPAGIVQFRNDAIIEDTGRPDAINLEARQLKVNDLPPSALQFLLPSRYCDVDSELSDIAWRLFGSTRENWSRVQAICDFVHGHLKFDYQQARANRTALEGYREKVGVCRDFMHLAITLCRCMNIPARYATGYLGDICVPPAPFPMDFSAWFEVFLDGRWWTFDARHNERRVGRVLMATGRDAADVALTTIFGKNQLTKFTVWTDEITDLDTPATFSKVSCLVQSKGLQKPARNSP
jgi:transglutaminase-like putative cysteine protease